MVGKLNETVGSRSSKRNSVEEAGVRGVFEVHFNMQFSSLDARGLAGGNSRYRLQEPSLGDFCFSQQ